MTSALALEEVPASSTNSVCQISPVTIDPTCKVTLSAKISGLMAASSMVASAAIWVPVISPSTGDKDLVGFYLTLKATLDIGLTGKRKTSDPPMPSVQAEVAHQYPRSIALEG